MPLETASFDAPAPISTETSGSACAVASETPTATRPPWTSWIFAEAKSRASARTVAEAAAVGARAGLGFFGRRVGRADRVEVVRGQERHVPGLARDDRAGRGVG